MYGLWWPCQEDGLIYEKRDKAIIVGSIVFLIFSTIDGALTLWGLSIGAIEEVNPVMQCLIEKSPIVFILSSRPCHHSWPNIVEDTE